MVAENVDFAGQVYNLCGVLDDAANVVVRVVSGQIVIDFKLAEP